MTEGAVPESFTLLIGPPRSGTTLIANAFMSHPAVSGVIEPYQRRRNTTVGSTEVDAFLAENEKDVSDLVLRPNLAVKETTTRRANVEMSLELMRSLAGRNIYTSLIIILRCPFAAFLSQVEASSELWAEKKLTEATGANFSRWINGQRGALRYLVDHARAQHYRLISYEAFCADPGPELARLMALVPLRVHADQLRFSPPMQTRLGGDPKTLIKSGKIEFSGRDVRVKEFLENFEGAAGFSFAMSFRQIVQSSVCVEPDHVVLDRLSRILISGV